MNSFYMIFDTDVYESITDKMQERNRKKDTNTCGRPKNNVLMILYLLSHRRMNELKSLFITINLKLLTVSNEHLN